MISSKNIQDILEKYFVPKKMSTLQDPAMEKMRRETLQNLQSTTKSQNSNSNSTRSYSVGSNLSQSKSSTSAINIPASSKSLSTNNSCSMLSRSPKYYGGLNMLK